MPAGHFTDQDFEDKVLKQKGVFFVDFYADWC
ncbi:TPA: thiol reductase thioredoxin, partial [Candidatus Beckwithbacteria bacterium]|nr:thiol reductase thioredoxin [Candidatus Beckwithbacteria bacterium]